MKRQSSMWLAVFFLVLLLAVAVVVHATTSTNSPSFNKEDILQEQKVEAFVTSFIKRDIQAKVLIYPSNQTLFSEGYRPTIGMPNSPEYNGERFSDLRRYFTRKLYLDLNSIRPLDISTFQSFVDQIGKFSDQSLICVGEISVKYDLNVQGPFVFENEIGKIPRGHERERFKKCWLNDAVLGTELRMLAWIHMQLFGTPYVNPENR